MKIHRRTIQKAFFILLFISLVVFIFSACEFQTDSCAGGIDQVTYRVKWKEVEARNLYFQAEKGEYSQMETIPATKFGLEAFPTFNTETITQRTGRFFSVAMACSTVPEYLIEHPITHINIFNLTYINEEYPENSNMTSFFYPVNFIGEKINVEELIEEFHMFPHAEYNSFRFRIKEAPASDQKYRFVVQFEFENGATLSDTTQLVTLN